ncbi:hypothetical protein KSP40_PGU004934 [Platanthera guangdongensis]|uniref:Uncharacterized protein n=1 Tax=Platanthera guangdongensis TaxID=2320717 RepID=A0ABR2MG90_9ASPA
MKQKSSASLGKKCLGECKYLVKNTCKLELGKFWRVEKLDLQVQDDIQAKWLLLEKVRMKKIMAEEKANELKRTFESLCGQSGSASSTPPDDVDAGIDSLGVTWSTIGHGEAWPWREKSFGAFQLSRGESLAAYSSFMGPSIPFYELSSSDDDHSGVRQQKEEQELMDAPVWDDEIVPVVDGVASANDFVMGPAHSVLDFESSLAPPQFLPDCAIPRSCESVDDAVIVEDSVPEVASKWDDDSSISDGEGGSSEHFYAPRCDEEYPLSDAEACTSLLDEVVPLTTGDLEFSDSPRYDSYDTDDDLCLDPAESDTGITLPFSDYFSSSSPLFLDPPSLSEPVQAESPRVCWDDDEPGVLAFAITPCTPVIDDTLLSKDLFCDKMSEDQCSSSSNFLFPLPVLGRYYYLGRGVTVLSPYRYPLPKRILEQLPVHFSFHRPIS